MVPNKVPGLIISHSMRILRHIVSWAVLLAALVPVTGCEGCRREVREQYYLYWEKLGREKREMLVKRVGKARGAQEEAREQFEDALEQFQALVGHQGGDLEKMYNKLKGEYENAESRAENVRQRIVKVENVAEALFREWREEMAQFDNAEYKRQSEEKLRSTKARYDQLLAAMQRASTSMDPVLTKLQDQVLFIKHNLNAQALGSLDREAEILETDVSQLIQDMQNSILEAERFIAEMSL